MNKEKCCWEMENPHRCASCCWCGKRFQPQQENKEKEEEECKCEPVSGYKGIISTEECKLHSISTYITNNLKLNG